MKDFHESIQKMVTNGIIRPCKFSAWSSPVNLVGKQDGSQRVTQDYRKLNAASIIDAYPLQNINQMISLLGKSKVFTKFDFTHGYYQVEQESLKHFTAFSCEIGQFEYNRLAMGLTYACETFQSNRKNVIFQKRKSNI